MTFRGENNTKCRNIESTIGNKSKIKNFSRSIQRKRNITTIRINVTSKGVSEESLVTKFPKIINEFPKVTILVSWGNILHLNPLLLSKWMRSLKNLYRYMIRLWLYFSGVVTDVQKKTPPVTFPSLNGGWNRLYKSIQVGLPVDLSREVVKVYPFLPSPTPSRLSVTTTDSIYFVRYLKTEGSKELLSSTSVIYTYLRRSTT